MRRNFDFSNAAKWLAPQRAVPSTSRDSQQTRKRFRASIFTLALRVLHCASAPASFPISDPRPDRALAVQLPLLHHALTNMQPDEVVNLVSSDSDVQPSRVRKRPRVTLSSSSSSDLEIVSHVVRGASQTQDLSQPDPSPVKAPANPNAATDVQCVGSRVGVRALVDYPHFRFQCVVEAFKRQRAAKKERFCVRCFCYVCDIPASECKEWRVHAKAVDSVHKWRVERESRLETRRRKDQATSPAARIPVVARHTRPAPVRQRIDEPADPPSPDELDVEIVESDGDEPLPMVDDFDDSETFDPVAAMSAFAIDPDCFAFESLALALGDHRDTPTLSTHRRNQSRRQATRSGGLR